MHSWKHWVTSMMKVSNLSRSDFWTAATAVDEIPTPAAPSDDEPCATRPVSKSVWSRLMRLPISARICC